MATAVRRRVVVITAVLGALAVVVVVAFSKQGVTVPVDQPGPLVESVTVDTAGTALTVQYGGSPRPAGQPCGEDYEVLLTERPDAVEVAVRVTAEFVPLLLGSGSCSGDGMSRTTTVPLATPLSGRLVVDGKDQHVVPVTAATS